MSCTKLDINGPAVLHWARSETCWCQLGGVVTSQPGAGLLTPTKTTSPPFFPATIETKRQLNKLRKLTGSEQYLVDAAGGNRAKDMSLDGLDPGPGTRCGAAGPSSPP